MIYSIVVMSSVEGPLSGELVVVVVGLLGTVVDEGQKYTLFGMRRLDAVEVDGR